MMGCIERIEQNEKDIKELQRSVLCLERSVFPAGHTEAVPLVDIRPVEIGAGLPSDRTVRATFLRFASDQERPLIVVVNRTADQLGVSPEFVRDRMKGMMGCCQ